MSDATCLLSVSISRLHYHPILPSAFQLITITPPFFISMRLSYPNYFYSPRPISLCDSRGSGTHALNPSISLFYPRFSSRPTAPCRWGSPPPPQSPCSTTSSPTPRPAPPSQLAPPPLSQSLPHHRHPHLFLPVTVAQHIRSHAQNSNAQYNHNSNR
ncbi:hypothetical protein BDQ17DRAFT_1343905 [Cyathus striatus]|nr:hypothetical protein BDQ17DRAFT_1343905 [Cyathus striatus]